MNDPETRESLPLIERPYNKAKNKTYTYKGRTYVIEDDGESRVYRAEDHSRPGKWYSYDRGKEVHNGKLKVAILAMREEDEAIRAAREKLARSLAQGDATFEQVLLEHLDTTDGIVEEPCFMHVSLADEEIDEDAPVTTQFPNTPFFRVNTEWARQCYKAALGNKIVWMEVDDPQGEDYTDIRNAFECFPLDDAETSEEAMERFTLAIRSLMLRNRKVSYGMVRVFFSDISPVSETDESTIIDRIVRWFYKKSGGTETYEAFKHAWLENLEVPYAGHDLRPRETRDEMEYLYRLELLGAATEIRFLTQSFSPKSSFDQGSGTEGPKVVVRRRRPAEESPVPAPVGPSDEEVRATIVEANEDVEGFLDYVAEQERMEEGAAVPAGTDDNDDDVWGPDADKWTEEDDREEEPSEKTTGWRARISSFLSGAAVFFRQQFYAWKNRNKTVGDVLREAGVEDTRVGTEGNAREILRAREAGGPAVESYDEWTADEDARARRIADRVRSKGRHAQRRLKQTARG